MPQSEKRQAITIALPQLYPGMQKGKIDFWWFEEEGTDIITPGHNFVRVETNRAYFDIPLPPSITLACRVKRVLRKVGEEVKPGEDLIVLELLFEQ